MTLTFPPPVAVVLHVHCQEAFSLYALVRRGAYGRAWFEAQHPMITGMGQRHWSYAHSGSDGTQKCVGTS